MAREPIPFTGDVPKAAQTRVPTKSLGRESKVAAQLLGLGYSVDEVVELIPTLEKTRLKVLMRSMLFRTEMDRSRERFIAAHADLVKERIYARGPKAVEVVEEIMDDPKHKDRLAAAREVLGRIVPMKSEAGRQEPTVVINISADQLKGINTVLAEYEELEGESTDVGRSVETTGNSGDGG